MNKKDIQKLLENIALVRANQDIQTLVLEQDKLIAVLIGELLTKEY